MIRFLFGAGEAGCFPNLTRMLSAWLPLSERVKAQAVMWAFGRWGGALAPPVAYFVIYQFGWRLGFVALAMIGVAWVAAFLPWFRNDPAQHKSVNAAELALLEGGRELVLHERGIAWYRLLLQKDIFFLGLQYFGFSYTWYFYVTWLPTWLQQSRGLAAGRGRDLCHGAAGLRRAGLDRVGFPAACPFRANGSRWAAFSPPPS